MEIKQYGIAMHCVSEGNGYHPDRETVRALRRKGEDCSRISELTGILSEEVETYCSQLGMPLCGSCSLKGTRVEESRSLLRCPVCGRLLARPARGRTRRFCSEDCKNRWWNQYRKVRRNLKKLGGENDTC